MIVYTSIICMYVLYSSCVNKIHIVNIKVCVYTVN